MLPFLLLLFELGFQWKINLVGELSYSEIFLLISSFYYIPKVNPAKNRTMQIIFIIFALLILVQVITENIIGNQVSNAMKGIAINMMAFLHINFLYYYFRKDPGLIKWLGLGIFLRNALWGAEITEDLDFADDETALAVFAKFRLFPMLEGLIIFLSFYINRKLFSVLTIFTGFIMILIGARSGGGMIAIAGIITYFIGSKKEVHIKHFGFYIVATLLGIYGLYCIYANQVLKGNIDAGNNTQLLKVENPYNPVNLLMWGRSEAFVGFMAFMDNPWTGWGAWAEDPDNYYHYIQLELHDEDYRKIDHTELIPGHSVLITSGLWNGVFAFILMCTLFFIVLKRGFFLLQYASKYYLIITYLLISFLWNMLFSPSSHLRLTLPLPIAFILVNWEIKHKEIKLKQKS